MEENKSMWNDAEKDILFSRTVRAGKRIYYIDVKKSRKEDLFITLTESKKTTNGNDSQSTVNYEKHKIFLYKEDFEKILSALHEAVDFAGTQNTEKTAPDTDGTHADEIKIDIDF